MLNQLIRPASLPAFLPSFFTRPLPQPTGLPAANLPTQIIAAPQMRWWEWRQWLVEAVANRYQPIVERRLRPMRQSASRHPVGSFLALCTNARLHRTHPKNQPLLRVDFHSEAERMQRGTGLITTHFHGPFTINHEVWWFLEGWLGWRLTAAQKRRGVDCAALVHRGAVLEVGRVFYPAGGTAACIHRALPSSPLNESHLRYRWLHCCE
jgi:hypothetical protein